MLTLGISLFICRSLTVSQFPLSLNLTHREIHGHNLIFTNLSATTFCQILGFYSCISCNHLGSSFQDQLSPSHTIPRRPNLFCISFNLTCSCIWCMHLNLSEWNFWNFFVGQVLHPLLMVIGFILISGEGYEYIMWSLIPWDFFWQLCV